MSHDPNEYDHNHDDCLSLPCPRCGCDPATGKYVAADFKVKRWSCSLCEPCWSTFIGDMDPEDRPLHLIEEAFP